MENIFISFQCVLPEQFNNTDYILQFWNGQTDLTLTFFREGRLLH